MFEGNPLLPSPLHLLTHDVVEGPETRAKESRLFPSPTALASKAAINLASPSLLADGEDVGHVGLFTGAGILTLPSLRLRLTCGMIMGLHGQTQSHVVAWPTTSVNATRVCPPYSPVCPTMEYASNHIRESYLI